MKRSIKLLLFISLLAGSFCLAQNSSQKDLAKESKEIKSKIKKAEQHQKELEKKKGNELDNLKVINKKVRLRESLIRNHRKEISKYDNQYREQYIIP